MSEPATGPIGGGEGYSRIVREADADVVVESKRELNDALLDASRGDVVFAGGEVAITNMADSEFRVPDGVTLASDRGHDGSKGALIKTEKHPWSMFEVGDDVRITGFRIAGPRWDWEDETETTEAAIDATGADGVEVDNCSLSGWGYAGVRTGDDTRVRFNDIHHCSRMGHGYGVATEDAAYPIIEFNHIWHCRHAVQGGGNGGYEACHNVIDGPFISHVFDQHRPGGTTTRIHHNTVRVVDDSGGRTDEGRAPAVAIRGVPEDVAEIHHNWLYNDKEPLDAPAGWTDESVIQVGVEEWDSVDVYENHYGESESDGEYGADPTAARESDRHQSDSGASAEPVALELRFETTGRYGFSVAGAVTTHPTSADVYRRGETTRVHGYAQAGWAPEFEITGPVEWLDSPDGTDVEFEDESYAP